MTNHEESARDQFVLVLRNFLKNQKAYEFSQYIKQLVLQFHRFRCNSNIKLHYLHINLDRFPENLYVLNRKKQSLWNTYIVKYQQQFNRNKCQLSDYCWSIRILTVISFFPKFTVSKTDSLCMIQYSARRCVLLSPIFLVRRGGNELNK